MFCGHPRDPSSGNPSGSIQKYSTVYYSRTMSQSSLYRIATVKINTRKEDIDTSKVVFKTK